MITHTWGLFHSLWIDIQKMTPLEYKQGGKELTITYSFPETPFGEMLIASTGEGVCYMAFVDDREHVLEELKSLFPNAIYKEGTEDHQSRALSVFTEEEKKIIKLHIKGTDFQFQVWKALLEIPVGKVVSYREIANKVGRAKAYRAVGTAVGDNPVAFLIPCHRVVRSSGALGGYHWGLERKSALIEWERSIYENQTINKI